jgi:WD40 repeat protein
MRFRFGRRVAAFLALLVVNSSFGCSAGDSHSGNGVTPTDSAKDRVSKADPKARAPKSFGVVQIDAFLGVSPDFTAYAVSDRGGVKLVDLESRKQVTSPAWDRDWGHPSSVVFGNNVIAVVTGRESVKVFSRKTGELEQNIRGQIDAGAFTADGRFLAITEFRPGNGYHLVLRDIQGKKTVAELRLGGNGYCSLAVAGKRVAAYESKDDQITIVEAESGAVVKKFKSGTLRKRKDFGGGRMPLAISPAGNLIAFEAEDAVVLYDIHGGKVAHKLEGHLDVVRAVGFSPNGETVVSGGKDKTIRFWNVKEGKEITAIKNLPTGVSRLIFSADGKRIAVVGARKAEVRSVEAK